MTETRPELLIGIGHWAAATWVVLLVQCAPGSKPSNDLPPSYYTDDTGRSYVDYNICRLPEPVAPTWDPEGDPCQALDGRVFQLPCLRVGFALGRAWILIYDEIDDTMTPERLRYSCTPQGAIANIADCDGEPLYTLDLGTGSFVDVRSPDFPFSLVSESLYGHFHQWFSWLEPEFEAIGGWEATDTVTGCP